MVQNSLNADLERLSALAYDRLGECGDLVREFRRLRRSARRHPDFGLLERVCAWLFVPITLWPIDLQSLCTVVQERIGEGRRLEKELRLLVESLAPLPEEKIQTVVAAHEHEVWRGDYGAQLKKAAAEKYCCREEILLNDPHFHREWMAIQAHFDLTQYRNDKGIIRRRMIAERAFRTDWQLKWHDHDSRFRAVFDAFCHRWHLYGMKWDRPLLMKLTINLTPHGTMIVIPSWWSLDHTRDLNWPEMKKLHNARVPSKQGAKLMRNQMEQAAEARKAAQFDAEAKAKGLRGERRADWVMDRLRWARKDSRKLRRVLNRAKRLEHC